MHAQTPSGCAFLLQSSLHQFLLLFNEALTLSEPAALVKQRVAHILSRLTATVVSWVTRGLYSDHKLMFKLLYLLKISVQFGLLSADTIRLLAFPGANGPPSISRSKPFSWIDSTVNCLFIHRARIPIIAFLQGLPVYPATFINALVLLWSLLPSRVCCI